MRSIEKRILMDVIMPMLNRENVITFIDMAYLKLNNDSMNRASDAG